MLVIFGEKRALVKYHSDNVGLCSHCNSRELSFAVFRSYFHFFFVPFFAVDEKEVDVLCLTCKEYDNSNPRANHYRQITRTPLYLYTGVILILTMIIGGILSEVL
jgi:hypothetical protein